MAVKAITVRVINITSEDEMNIGYIRVSTQEQSTARQLHNIVLDMEPFVDKISGVVKDRPKLTECLAMLRKGDVLHVHSIDRLSRSIRNLLDIIDVLMSKGVTLHVHKENILVDPDNNNPFTQMQLKLFAMFAEFERDVSKERQREGIAMTKINGTKSGKPFGNQPLDYAKLSPKVLALHRQGLSNRAIALELKLARSSIAKLLTHANQSLLDMQ